MSNSDVDEAVAAALSLDWQKAFEINQKIHEETPDDVDCLNRLGRACLELGDNKKAITCFRRVLKLSKYNQIAIKNLTRATQLGTKKLNSMPFDGHDHHTPISFLEEPGKTKLVTLVNTAPLKTLLSLNYGEKVQIAAKRHTILVSDCNDNYLGALPDDIGHRLLVLLTGGNKYDGYVRSVNKNSVSIFLIETSRAKKFHNTPSFPASGAEYLSFIREDALSEESQSSSSSDDEEADGAEVTHSKSENIHQDEVGDEGN